MKPRSETGTAGETEAVKFLKKNGFRIIERNFRTKSGEIDIIALDKGVICFVEVRARRGLLDHFQALASVDSFKQKRLSKLALAYLKKKRLLDKPARFDVVSVLFCGGKNEICLVKNAFDAGF